MTRQDHRLALGAAAILSVSQAAGLLPIADAEARSWLRAKGLVRDLCGREVVVWGHVLAELELQAALSVARGIPYIDPEAA